MFTSRLREFLIASLLMLGSAAAQSAELITNGGFEAGGTGWTKTETVKFIPITDYGPCCSPFGIYPYGSRAAFFGGGDTTGGSMLQDFGTVAGSFYTLSFAYGAISETRPQRMRASIFDVPGGLTNLASMALFTFGTQDLGNMMNDASIMFQAQSALTRISFVDISAGTTSVDGVIDAVSVLGPAPIPEPSTYALMLVGLGIVVFAARRRARGAAVSV